MPTISEYLQIAAGGAGVVFANVGVWVQMVNNATGVAYVSTAATDSQGKYTVQNVPAGTYTVNTGPTSIGPWTSTGDTAYAVGDQSFNFNVKDFGAKGDGATDDSTSIQNTINTANTAGGGTVYFPPGTYTFSNVNFYRKIQYLGAGIENTILKLRTGSSTSVPLLQSNSFTTLASGGGGSGPGTSTGGEFNFTFEQLTIDGNKANVASTVPMFRVYGYGFVINDVIFRNSNNVNVYSEWATSLPAPGPDSMEAHLNSLKVHDAGSHGILWQGPHDTNIVNVECFNNGVNGFRADGNGNGCKISNSHSWGLTQTVAWYFNSTGCQLISGVAEGASTAQVVCNANDCQVSADNIFAAGGGTTGIIIGDTTTVTGTVIFTKVQNCTTAAINFKNDGGSFVQCLSFQTSGPAFIGTPNTDTLALIQVKGGGTSPLLRIPTVLDVFNGRVAVHGGNAVRLYSAADSGFAEFSFDGTQVVDTWPLFVPALRRTRQAKSFATPETTDPTQGGVVSMTLTNNLTVNNPTQTNAGQEILYIWTQDGTGGRTVTYSGGNFAAGGVAAMTTTLNTTTLDHFVCDGTKWRIKSRVTGQ